MEGKTLADIHDSIKKSDANSRVTTKAGVGDLIEQGFFNMKRNNDASPDIKHLGVEVKTSPLKYLVDGKTLRVKEPLSLNIINYNKEVNNKSLKDSSLYKKNNKILFIFYIHEKDKERSNYLIAYVFLWEMTDDVINELEPDYNLILDKIKSGKAHEIHQGQHEYLTICPKHGGKFKDPDCRKSKTSQPFSNKPAEVRAFRLKNKYVNKIIERYIKQA